jgi:tetratricopeptide (TPR) repeat protein
MKPEETNLEQIRWKFEHILYQKQNEFFRYYSAGDFEHASATIAGTLEIVDQILPEFLPAFPNDLWLQQVRAYTFKNYAMLMRSVNRIDEFNRGLSEAEKMFKAIRDQNPKEAGAWNGLGSIAALRGEYEKALVYIDMALEIAPDYEAALQDKEMVLRLMKR